MIASVIDLDQRRKVPCPNCLQEMSLRRLNQHLQFRECPALNHPSMRGGA